MTLKTIDIYLSGGASNTDPNESLGGVRSNTKLYGQTVSYDGDPLGGVTMSDAAGLGGGTLSFQYDGTLLALQKAGGAAPVGNAWVDVSSDGVYTLTAQEGDAFVVVAVVSASLPVVDASAAIAAASLSENLFDNVPSNIAQVGGVDYRHVYIYNNSASVVSPRLYIKQQYIGLDYLEIGVKQLESGIDPDELLPDAQTPPSAVEFSAPADFADGLTLTIQPEQALGVYLKRTVPPLSDIGVPNDNAVLVLEIAV